MNISPVSVILPTLNEAGNIEPLVEELLKTVNPNEIIIIDDDSTDGTGTIAKFLTKKYSRVKAVINSPPKGLTKSIQKGIDISTSLVVVWMDADFSHPPKVLKKMINKLKSADLIVGSWLALGGRDDRKEKLHKTMSFFINNLCRLLFDRRITAYTSGFILVKKEVINGFRLKGDYGEYCIDLLVRMSAKGNKIVEVPFRCVSRKKGETKTAPNIVVYIKKGLKYLVMILSLLHFIPKMNRY